MSYDGVPTPDFDSFPVTDARQRKTANRIFMLICWITTLATLAVLVVLLGAISWTAAPVFQAKPDLLESAVWASIAQGDGPDNDPQVIDSGDYLQGIFAAERLSVGGLLEEDDEVYEPGNSRVGVFSLELVQDPANPRWFHGRPAKGERSVASLLDAASIDWQTLTTAEGTFEDAGIAILRSADPHWSIDQLNGSRGLLHNGRLAQSINGDSGWRSDQLIGIVGDEDFCRLEIQPALLDQTSNAIPAEPLRRLRRKQKLGKITGLFSIIGHDPAIESIGLVKNLSTEGKMVEGQVAIEPRNGLLAGRSRSQRHGFEFGGNFKLTENLLPDQGTAGQHLRAFLRQTPKTDPMEAGIGPALAGTLWVCAGCALFALPLGIGTAICLEEFKPRNRLLAKLHSLVQLNITNLAGVPSIVYGIVGLTAFGTMFGLFGKPKEPLVEFGAKHYFQYISEGERILKVPAIRDVTGESKWAPAQLSNGMEVLQGKTRVKLIVVPPDQELPEDPGQLSRTLFADAEGGLIVDKPWYYVQLPLGRGVLAASLTLMLVILPVIIIASQEALRAVPATLRQGALGLGSTRWQTVRTVTLPAAVPSIMTGAILAMSRAIGEAAPIIVLAGIVYISSGPQHLMDSYSVLPVQIFYWAGLPIDDLAAVNWQNVASAGIVVLLAILLSFNAVAVAIRHWTHQSLS